MCSTEITELGSCYIDNWHNIFSVIGVTVSLGITSAVLVGVIYLIIKKA